MARWLALCPRPIKGDQCLRPQTRKLPVKKFLHSANISRGSLMRYGLKLMKFDDRQRLSPERTGLLITPAVRARGCSLYFVFMLFCFDSLMRRRHAWKAVSRWSRTSLTGTSALHVILEPASASSNRFSDDMIQHTVYCATFCHYFVIFRKISRLRL